MGRLMAGAWAVGKRGKTENWRWIWALSVLALLNIAFYWIFIPYRTQQRFMLQALGLGHGPSGKPVRSSAPVPWACRPPAGRAPAHAPGMAIRDEGIRYPLGP